MSGAKPLASLSPSLLARKGAARPAMRTQLQPMRLFHEATAREMDDLGWNDMGPDEPVAAFEPAPVAVPIEAEIVTLKAATVETPAPTEPAASEPAAAQPPAIVPEVVRQQEQLAKRIEHAGRRSALSDGRRAAFTLRLDAERHLKLRLACTVSNRSAQQIVTEALDRLIAEQPDLAALAEQIRTSR